MRGSSTEFFVVGVHVFAADGGWQADADEGNDVLLTDGTWHFHSTVHPKDPRRTFTDLNQLLALVDRDGGKRGLKP